MASLEEVLNEVSKLKEENKQLRDKCDQLTKENKHLNFISSNSEVFNIEKYKDNPDDIAFYTGLSDYEMLMMCYNLAKDSAKNISYNYERIYCDLESTKQPGRPKALSTFQEFIMTLVRIRLGLFERDLGHRFNVSHMSVSRITNSWLRFLRSEFEPLIQIPPDDVLKFHMPKVFKDELASVGVVLVKPNFLKDKKQFSTKETEHNKTIASLRVHVERLMECIKNWHIFIVKFPFQCHLLPLIY